MQLFSWRDAIEAAPAVGALMAGELHWTDAAARAAIVHYVEKITHLLDSAGLATNRASSTSGGQSKGD
jgi:hypothetical protein